MGTETEGACPKLTVKSIVDAVNGIFRSWVLRNKSTFVLLDHILFSRGKSRNAIYITNRLVWPVRNDLPCRAGVHAGEAKIGTDIGVVDINGFATAKVGDILVIYNSVSSGRDSSGTDGSCGSDEGTAVRCLRIQRSLDRWLGVWGERSHSGD